jgi:UDP-N-acetylmuramate-alanine ligase
MGAGDINESAPIYSSAREQNTGELNSDTVADQIKMSGRAAFTVPNYPDVVQFLDRNTGPGDIVVFMGAGDINEWANSYAKSSEILG